MRKRCWKLFSSMLLLSACTFGGGYVIIPLMRKRFVEELNWLKEEEMLEMTAFARSSPGAVTVNVAVQVGMKAAGSVGAIAGVLGTVLPPLAILSLISRCYNAFSTSMVIAALLYGMRLAVAIVVSESVAAMTKEVIQCGTWADRTVMGAVFLLSLITELSTIWLLAGSVALGCVLSWRAEV